jgi:hypothetical protein
VKPAKLLADEQNNENKPATVENPLKSENKRSEVVKAGEKADAEAKEKEDLIKQCRLLISGYRPIRNNREDAREREDMQKKWTGELNEAEKRTGELNEAEKRTVHGMREFTKALAAKIQKRYADREKASERL